MKKLLFPLLATPCVCVSQKIEISELGGACLAKNQPANDGNLKLHYTNELTAGYYLDSHFSLAAMWRTDLQTPKHNYFGLIPEYHARKYYIGIMAALIDAHNYSYDHIYLGSFNITKVTYSSPGYAVGVHAGIRQHVGGHFYLKEQVELNYCYLKGSNYSNYYYSTGQFGSPEGPFTNSYLAPSLMIGLSYR